MQAPDIKEELDNRLQEIIDSHVSSLSADFRRLIGELPLQVAGEDDGAGDRQARAMSNLKASVEAIHAAANQREMAYRLLDATSHQAARSALLLTRGAACVGFEARGFDQQEVSFDEMSFNPQGDDPLAGAVNSQETLHLHGSSLAGSALAGWLGEAQAQQVCLAPVVVGGQTVALLYADSGLEDGNHAIYPESVEILASVAGMFLERMRRPADAPAADTTESAPDAPDVNASSLPVSDGPEFDEDEPEAMAAAGDDSPALAGPDLAATPQEESEDDLASTRVLVGGEDESPAFDPSATVALSDLPAPEAVAVASDEADQAVAEAEDDATDAQENEDAMRFARLLVSEIVLYNEAQVKAGRKNADLLTRLKDPIQRSREAYEERFGAATLRLFDEELVRTLAEGDRSLLGVRPS